MNKTPNAQRSLVTFGALIEGARFQTLICHNPYHVHQTPVQLMTAVEYRGHRVSITKDGHLFSIRIDRNPLTDKHNLSAEEAIAYVESMTEVHDVR